MRRPLLLLLPLLAGCPRAERPYPPPTSAEVLAVLGKGPSPRAMRVDARVDYLEAKGERIKLTMTFVVDPPARLRIDAESPIGGSTVASLASDGREFQLLDARTGRFLVGPARPCNIARLIRVHLLPADVVALLGGAVPLDGAPEPLRWDPQERREVLTLVRGEEGERRDLHLEGRPGDWRVARVDVRDLEGRLRYRVSFEWEDGPGARRYPARLAIEEPARGVDLRLRFKDREVGDIKLPPGVFRLEPPTGMTPEQVACD